MEVWACLNRMKTVAVALWTVHQTWRSRGSQNRVLLKLLAEVDNKTYLEPAAREQMSSDISAYTHALFPTNENPGNVPPVLPEILMLATDSTPEAPSLLANSLWYKYMTSPDWAWKVWDNTVASLRQLPAMMSDVPSRRACALDTRLSCCTWINTFLEVVLLYLNCYGALATTTILESLVFQVWQAGANVSSEEQGQALETLLTSVNTLFEHLLLRDECGTGLPPVDVFEAQGLLTRRREVFREPHFSTLVSNFPALVLIEQNRFLSETLRTASTTLRKTICRVNVFRQVASIPDDLHEPLVGALRLMLNDPGQDGPVNAADLHSVSSLLSHWKLAATSVEIRLTIKQLQEGISREPTRVAAYASLDRLTSAVFYSCRQPEEADFIADLIINVDRTVAGKDPHDLKKCASEILRLMANIVAPLRKDESLPQLDPLIQESFFAVLCVKIKKMTETMATLLQNPWEEEAARGTQAVVFMARMLQFYLGFSITWSQQAKDLAEELCFNLTRLALMHGAGESLNMLVFPLVLDTLCYTLDEIPMDVKATAPFDPFRNYPEFNLSDLPADMPPEYKARMRSLLPYVELNPAVEGLVYVTRDASGAIISSVPVQNRPWEWTEYIGDNPAGEMSRGGDERVPDDRPHVKNSAALSLDLFEARVTGDRVILPPKQVHQGFLPGVEDMMAEENLRSFQDDVFSEGPFRRDWRETRIPFDDAIGSNPSGRRNSPHGDDNINTLTPLPALSGHAVATGASDHRASSRRPSPASSVRSAGSARSGGSHHAFSRLSASTTGEVIDVDALEPGGSGTGSSNKRKAMSTIAEEDSDIEIIEGPVPTLDNRGQKRAKARAAGNTVIKGKRR
uniref:Non-specific serine/threonine protein kinase (EC) n=1 Tax=Ganoderma boninense TaxID=34458 RepID=A0A5K1K736_9APHY|nr:Non-specific serine/threonine protein kinase (EC [Ganoderma boninense]